MHMYIIREFLIKDLLNLIFFTVNVLINSYQNTLIISNKFDYIFL